MNELLLITNLFSALVDLSVKVFKPGRMVHPEYTVLHPDTAVPYTLTVEVHKTQKGELMLMIVGLMIWWCTGPTSELHL